MLLQRDRTANWMELTLPVLGAYRLDENGESDRLYVNDLVIEGAAMFPIGQKWDGRHGVALVTPDDLWNTRAESDTVTQCHDAEGRSSQLDISVRRFDSDLERAGFRSRTMSALEIDRQYASPPT